MSHFSFWKQTSPWYDRYERYQEDIAEELGISVEKLDTLISKLEQYDILVNRYA